MEKGRVSEEREADYKTAGENCRQGAVEYIKNIKISYVSVRASPSLRYLMIQSSNSWKCFIEWADFRNLT